MRASASSLSRPSTNRSASARNVCTLASREAAVAQHLRVGREQLGRRRQVPSEPLLEMRDDRPGRADGQLLARDLEDERAEGVEWRKLVQPGARTEVRPRVDQPREHRIGVAQELARLAGLRLLRVACGIGAVHAHTFSSRSVSTISIDVMRPSPRAPSRAGARRRARPSGPARPPAWTTRSRPARCASSRRAADRVDDGIDVVALAHRVEGGEGHADLGPERAEDQLAPPGGARQRRGSRRPPSALVRRPVDRWGVCEERGELGHGRLARVRSRR